jgi:hypothetical protein
LFHLRQQKVRLQPLATQIDLLDKPIRLRRHHHQLVFHQRRRQQLLVNQFLEHQLERSKSYFQK